MARGKDAHDARIHAVAALGKALSRRAGSRCELCEAGSGLRPVEVPPLPEEPDLDAALLLCERCRDLIDAKRLPADTHDLRFLAAAIWSDLPPVQTTAERLLRRLAPDTPWAAEALDLLA